MKRWMTAGFWILALLAIGWDPPAENATEERIEDAGERAGQSEDAAEERGEAVKDGDLTATATTGTTSTTATTTTATTTTQ